MNKTVAGVHGQNGIVPSNGKRVDGGRLVLFDEVVKGAGGLLKFEVDGLLAFVGVPGFELTVVEDSLLMSWWFLQKADWAALELSWSSVPLGVEAAAESRASRDGSPELGDV